MKGRRLTKENFILILCLVVTLVLAVVVYRNGLSRKWNTAIFGTVVPFGVVLARYPLRWRRWSFWTAFAMCLVLHLLAIWAFFQYVILGLGPGWGLWIPVAFVETFVLLVTVRIIENKLLGKHPRTIGL